MKVKFWNVIDCLHVLRMKYVMYIHVYEVHFILMSHCKCSSALHTVQTCLMPPFITQMKIQYNWTCKFSCCRVLAFCLPIPEYTSPPNSSLKTLLPLFCPLDGLEVITEEKLLTCVCQGLCPVGRSSIATSFSLLLPALPWTNLGWYRAGCWGWGQSSGAAVSTLPTAAQGRCREGGTCNATALRFPGEVLSPDGC